MMAWGPVSSAAHGGRSSPLFDFFMGFSMLAGLLWACLGPVERPRPRLGTVVGIAGIGLFFILIGIVELLR